MGYICEPSGALAVAGLNKIRNILTGKKVVCLLTGSNMDLSRLEMARELNAISKGYKNYYIV
jgi:threonine dehydratase